MVLPLLREELALYPAPPHADGQPAWTLHDPTRNRFFQIDWLTFEALSRWSLGSAESIALDIDNGTTLRPDETDIEHIASFLAENELVQPALEPGWAAGLAERRVARKGSLSHRLLHNYLFFRVPLLRPDAWLARLAPMLDFFYGRLFFRLTLLAFAFGFVLVSRDWDRFSSSLVDTLTWQGFVAWGVALVGVKILHELGHAVTAKRHGCRVPTMGVAFVVLWPMAYTDTNEAWKLAERHERFQVAAAGVATELIVAVWATLLWALLPEGALRSMMFVLATITWVMSVAINCSPFMRFDGYFLLVDWLNFPNLHERSFALARWRMRELLFDLQAPVPERLPAFKRRMLVLFAWATWVYRLFLFLGIAVVVYFAFAKALGVFLFLVELGWFIFLPIYREALVWKTLMPTIRERGRGRRWLLGAGLLLLVACLPLPSRVVTSGLLHPVESFPVYTQSAAMVRQVPVGESGAVAAGQILVELSSPELESRHQAVTAKVERLRQQAGAAAFDPELRAQMSSLQEQLATAEAELNGIVAEMANLAPKAPFAGRMRDLDPDLKPGVWLKSRERIGTLVGAGGWRVEAFVDEDAVHRLRVGDGGRFFPEGAGDSSLALQVVSVDSDATRVLSSGILAAPAGGNVVIRRQGEQRIPERAAYRVVCLVEGDTLAPGAAWRGDVVLRGAWEVPVLAYARAALALFWREFGF